jgi:glycosyltransferase involved in cell wall biosynthesis
MGIDKMGRLAKVDTDLMQESKVAIYIPAYNAEKQIISVLERIANTYGEDRVKILVVDNASTDRTSGVVKAYTEKNGLTKIDVIRNAQNQGYGGSQKIGYRTCIERGFDVAAMVHSDGQYAPELLPELLKPIVEGKADMIFGSRIAGHPLKGGMPIHRYLGNLCLTTFQNLFLGLNLSEYHSGYRIYSLSALQKVPFEKLANDFHFDTEIIILMKHMGMRISEVAIPTRYADEDNHVNIWKYGIDVLVTTFSYWLHARGIRRSRNWSKILD